MIDTTEIITEMLTEHPEWDDRDLVDIAYGFVNEMGDEAVFEYAVLQLIREFRAARRQIVLAAERAAAQPAIES
jgi:hypothetical protein